MTRAQAAQTNGTLSHGPVTEQGKARSARNAITHGLNASDVVIAGEDQASFHLLLASLHEYHHPVSPAERDLVFEIAASRWRLRRIRRMETDVINAEVHRLIHHPEAPIPPELAESAAFVNIAEGPALRLLHRYESRLRRSCEKAEKELANLLKLCPRPLLADPVCIAHLQEFDERRKLQNEPDESSVEADSLETEKIGMSVGQPPSPPEPMLSDRVPAINKSDRRKIGKSRDLKQERSSEASTASPPGTGSTLSPTR